MRYSNFDDLDRAIAAGALGFLVSTTPLQLEVVFDQDAAVRLREAPLSADQELVDRSDGSVLLRASAADTVQLRTWLRGFGARIEVLQPPALRQEFVDQAQAMTQRYASC